MSDFHHKKMTWYLDFSELSITVSPPNFQMLLQSQFVSLLNANPRLRVRGANTGTVYSGLYVTLFSHPLAGLATYTQV